MFLPLTQVKEIFGRTSGECMTRYGLVWVGKIFVKFLPCRTCTVLGAPNMGSSSENYVPNKPILRQGKLPNANKVWPKPIKFRGTSCPQDPRS
jgi:hypothetical protein